MPEYRCAGSASGPSAVAECFRESLRLYREAGDKPFEARSLWLLAVAMVPWDRELPDAEWEAVLGMVREAVELARSSGDDWTLSLVLMGAWQVPGTPAATANQMLVDAVEAARSTGDQYLICETLRKQSDFVFDQGDRARARLLAEEALDVARGLNDKPLLLPALNHLGHLLANGGNPALGRVYLEEVLKTAIEVGARGMLHTIVGAFCNIAKAEGDMRRAARCWYACQGFYTGNSDMEGQVAKMVEILGIEEKAARAECMAAEAMSFEEVVAYCLEGGSRSAKG